MPVATVSSVRRARNAPLALCKMLPIAALALPASALAPSCLPKRGCSTAGAPPRLGCARARFFRPYPKVRPEPDQIFVRDGNIWSSAGITAGIDLALAMVAEDHGDEIAQKTARQLVLYHRRSGGQSQF